MSAHAPLRILMVVDAAADARTVATLIDKVLVEHEERAPWFDDGLLDSQRAFVSLDRIEPALNAPPPLHTTWDEMKRRSTTSGVRVLGHGLSGPVRNFYAAAARRAIAVGALAASKPNAVVLIVDADAQPTRADGVVEAREADPPSLTVVVGAADPEREAWILNAFEPVSDAERGSKLQLHRELTFDPCREAHKLRSKEEGAPRCIKRVLRVLVPDAESDTEVLRARRLEELVERGSLTGLSAFLVDAARLLPMIGAGPNHGHSGA